MRRGYVRPLLDDDETLEIEAGRHPVVEAALEGATAQLGQPAGLRPQRLPPGHHGRADRHHHRPQHGRQEHLPALRRPDRPPGPGGQLRPRGARPDRAGRPHLHPRRRPGRPRRRAEHLHGGDGGDGQHPPPRHAQEPGHPGRDRAGDEHLRRRGHRPGRGGAPARPPGGPPDAVRHPLPRAGRPGGRSCPGCATTAWTSWRRATGWSSCTAWCPASAGRSYGIHVARLAGVPRAVTRRAEEVLAGLEGRAAAKPPRPPAPRRRAAPPPPAPAPAQRPPCGGRRATAARRARAGGKPGAQPETAPPR